MQLSVLMKRIGFLTLACMPNGVKRFVYNRFLGAEIHPTARIGFSYVQAKKIKMGPNARIGHFNIIRNLELLKLGEKSWIGRFNHISAVSLGDTKHFTTETDRFPALIVGKDSELGNRHFYDCSNTIQIGDKSCILGFGTAIYTHGVNTSEVRQETKKVVIGDNCRIYTRCVIVKGSHLPNNSFLGPHSVLTKAYDQDNMFYSGVPATAVKELDYAAPYFDRKKCFVD